MKIDDVSFADGFVESFKTEKDFLKEMQGKGYLHIFHGEDRQERLKKVYELHHAKKNQNNLAKP